MVPAARCEEVNAPGRGNTSRAAGDDDDAEEADPDDEGDDEEF